MTTSKPHTLYEYASSTLSRPDDTYLYAVLPTSRTANALTFATPASDDTITDVAVTEKGVLARSTAPARHNKVTCIASLRGFIVTGGDDGCLRVVGERDYMIECSSAGRRKGISALVGEASLGMIAAGTASEREGAGDVEVYLWQVLDSSGALLRPARLVQRYTESHTDTITALAFMRLPSSELRLVSASTDGLVNVFNTSIADEDDAVEETINNKSPVHYLTLSPPSGSNSLHSSFVISGEEHLMHYQIGEGCSAISDEVDIRDTFQCDYTVKIVTSTAGRVHLVTGAYKEETTPTPNVKIWDVSQDKPDRGPVLLAELKGAHGEEVVRDVWWEDNFGVALSCGEDGAVRAWKTAGSGNSAENPRTKKGEAGGSRKDARFRPY